MEQRLPPLKSLHFFLVAAQQQSFKRAALELNVTQAAVSQQIRMLESVLDCRLFERGAKSTQLTEQGMRLLPHIELGFQHLKQGVRSISTDPNPNCLRISVIHSFTSLWLMPRLQDFQAQHPDIMVQLAPSNELVDFKDGDLDLAIRIGGGDYPGLEDRKVLADRLVLVASPALLDGIDKDNPQQVFSLPWIEDTTSGIQISIMRLCQRFNVDREALVPIVRSENALPLIEFAVSGKGIVLMNSSLVADHIQAGKLVPLLGFNDESHFSLMLVAPPQHFTWSKVSAFEQWFLPKVRESFSDLSRW